MKKKLLTVLLVAAFMGIAAACGEKKEPVTPPAGPEPTVEESSETATSDSSSGDQYDRSVYDKDGNFSYDLYLQKWDPVDLGGRAIKLYGMSGSSKEELAKGRVDYFIDILNNWNRVEEKYNVTLSNTQIDSNDADEMLRTSVLAGQPYADFVFLSGHTIIPTCIQGYVNEFKDYVPKNGDLLNEQKYLSNINDLFGKSYIFQSATSASVQGIYAHVFGVNLDIINEVGCENPIDLYENGEWTWEKLEDICREVQKASTDARPLWGLSGDHAALLCLFIAANGGQTYDMEAREDKFDSPQILEAFNFYAKLLMDDKVIYVFRDDVQNGAGNTYSYQTGEMAMFPIVAHYLDFGGFDFEIGVVPCPKGPSNTDGKTFFSSLAGIVMPRGVEDPMLVYQILEEQQSWWQDDPVYLLAWRDTYRNTFHSDEDFTRLKEVGKTQGKLDLFMAGRTWMLNRMIQTVWKDGETPAQSIASQRQSIVQSLVTFMGIDKMQ